MDNYREISVEDAIKLFNKYTNSSKRTYVRVDERKFMENYKIVGTLYTLQLHTVIYSKTWSKTKITFYRNGKFLLNNRVKALLFAKEVK